VSCALLSRSIVLLRRYAIAVSFVHPSQLLKGDGHAFKYCKFLQTKSASRCCGSLELGNRYSSCKLRTRPKRLFIQFIKAIVYYSSIMSMMKS
jgi:hypothetical protein